MEVAGMMPVQHYNPALQYAQYHDLRTPVAASSMHHPAVMGMARHANYSHYHQPHAVPLESPSSHHIPTPPEDPNKPSLPSISNLIGIADGERSSQASPESRSPSQNITSAPRQSMPVESMSTQYPQASDTYPMHAELMHKSALPPTPPMRSDSMPDAVQSPSTISSHSSFSGPTHGLGISINNVDAAQQRHYVPSMHMAKPQQPMYSTPPYAVGPYLASPTSVSSGYSYSPESVYQNTMYQQRPLPSNFHPAVMAAQMLPPGMIATSNPWEHHHYLNAANPQFPSVQDRYVCVTCKKAFSRPSSLKIHSHSHTGEKPFRCPHQGCGKAFSVRSNMKRHERGCHTPGMASATPS